MTPEVLNALVPASVLLGWPLLLAVERWRPLTDPPPTGKARHVLRNLGVVAVGFAFNFPVGPVLLLVAAWARARGLGLLALAPLPPWLDVLAGAVLMDLVDYGRHRLVHRVPLLWRLHRVHHLDESPDSSTGMLNHPLEAVPSLLVFAVAVPVLGLSPMAIAVRMMVGMSLLLFHHSNLALPDVLDRALAWLTPTPRTHRVHHARDLPWTDSNFGTCLTVWDRLFGTWRERADVARMPTGLDGEPRPGVGAMLASPFRRAG